MHSLYRAHWFGNECVYEMSLEKFLSSSTRAELELITSENNIRTTDTESM